MKKIQFICGFAGSGKSTATAAISLNKNTYIANFDPAARYLPYEPHFDIRDNVDYTGVMREYSLGPNGAIVTCMNLFAGKIDQIVSLFAEKLNTYDTIVVDTPGQIEVFTWSASGEIMVKSMQSAFPNCSVEIVYVMRKKNAALFRSNMLYACSIQLKMGCKLRLVENLVEDDCTDTNDIEDETYASSLTDSINDKMEKIYHSFPHISVDLYNSDDGLY